MATIDNIVADLRKAIESAKSGKTQAYDTVATVKRVAGNTAWVQIPGGTSETPVQLTIACQPGDTVQVRVGGGRAWLTGNQSAPPTDDREAKVARSEASQAQATASKAHEVAEEASTVAGEASATALNANQIASNTNQYFWHTETGDDTGAHITEKTQEEFLADPQNGGGNTILRSNGMAVRDGLTELASFGADKAVIGKEDETHAEVSNEGLKVINPDTGETMYIWNTEGSGMVISGSLGTKISGSGVDPYNYIWFDGDLLSNGIPIDGIITKHYGYGTNPVWRWDVFAPQERNNGEASIDYVYTVRGSVRYDASITLTTSSGNGWYRNSSVYTLGIPQKLQKANLYYGGFYSDLPHHFVLSSCHISVMCGGGAYYFATPAAWTATQLRYWVGHLGSVSTSNAIILVDFSGYYELDDDAIPPE